MTSRVTQLVLKIAHLAISMKPLGPRDQLRSPGYTLEVMVHGTICNDGF